MRFRRPKLVFLLDEGVPNGVGRVLEGRRHVVFYVNKGNVVPRGSKDQTVAAAALSQRAILVATDGDMRAIARGHGVSKAAYAKLNLLKLSCLETEAANRVEGAISLIEHEWHVNAEAAERRLYVEISHSVIRSFR